MLSLSIKEKKEMEKNRFFPEINGNFGFGCMRLPMNGDEVDLEETSRMADAFIEAGFNYFDTAHGYIRGKSELAIRECISKRHDRNSFLLADKLTEPFFNSEEDVEPFIREQLELCGVEYFDFYLMHAQGMRNYEKFKRCRAYEVAYGLKQKGLIRHLGISFHDTPETLDMILTEHPEVEFVQIQFNYADYDDAAVQSRQVYEVCGKHGKPVVVMEPVKGGTLVNLPGDADAILKGLKGGSNASYALRFAAGFPDIAVVLSGMSNMEQMEDNISTMKDFQPLSEKEQEAIEKVREVFKGLDLIPCTACRYCIEESECPMKIRIPDLFAAMNNFQTFHSDNSFFYYGDIITGHGHGKASECLKCGKCEKVCPQHLPIREYLEKVAATFEN